MNKRSRHHKKAKGSKSIFILGLVLVLIVFAGSALAYQFLNRPSVNEPTESSSAIVKNTTSSSTSSIQETSSSEYVAYEHTNVPILMYHAIDEYNGDGIQELFVTPTNFKEQMSYLKDNGYSLITFADLEHIEDYEKPILITLDDGYKNNINAYDILTELSDDKWQGKATIFMIDTKIDGSNGLTATDIKKMSQDKVISFQSHTTNHLDLTTVTDFETEFGNNKNHLEELTGQPVIAVSYPAGRYDDNVMSVASEYYQYAVTTNPGKADLLGSMYELQRVRINYSDTLDTFVANIE